MSKNNHLDVFSDSLFVQTNSNPNYSYQNSMGPPMELKKKTESVMDLRAMKAKQDREEFIKFQLDK